MQNIIKTDITESIKNLIETINQAEQIPQEAETLLKSFVNNDVKENIVKHWKQIINIILALLCKHPQLYTFKGEDKLNEYLQLTQAALKQHVNNQELYNHLNQKLSSDIDIQSQLFLLNLLIDLSIKQGVNVCWQRQLPLEIRTAGLILHKYLKLIREKSSGSSDRLPADIIVEKNCQKWIQELFISSINKYKTIINKNNNLRRYFINFGTDLSEALLQSFLQSQLNKQILTCLLIEVSRVFIQEYSVAQLSSTFSQTLHINKMITPVKPVQIVEIYTPQLLINPNGFNYLVKSILSQPEVSILFSEQSILRGLLPILGQSIKRQLPIKHDILDLALKIIPKSTIQLKSDDELGYPISLLITNLVISKQNQANLTNEKIDKLLKVVMNWKWSLNRCLDFSSKVQIKKFVLQQINSQDSLNNYFIFNTLNPIESQKQYTELYLNTLLKLKSKEKEYHWVSNLIKEKRKNILIDDKFKQA